MFCEFCESEMRLTKKRSSAFHIHWYCVKCKKTLPLLYNTFFSSCKGNHHLYIRLIYCFVHDYDLKKTSHETGFSLNTVSLLFSKIRIRIYDWYKRDESFKIGGIGLEVEVDETHLSRRKYNIGRITSALWVVGGICSVSDDIFLVYVDNRSEDNLNKIIKKNVKFGSIIVTDSWKGYNFLDSENPSAFQHNTVNHKENFVDPDTGCSTQKIERLWLEFKMMKKKKRGFHLDLVEYYLAEFIYRRNTLRHSNDPFLEILDLLK